MRAYGVNKGDTRGWGGLLLTGFDAVGKYKRVGFAAISCDGFLYDIDCEHDLEDDRPYEEFWQKQKFIEVPIV